MKFQHILAAGMLTLSLFSGGAFAATKAERQAEVQKATHTALEKFYKTKPELKAAVAKAPGYAVFTTYGVSFLVGGSGGTGLVHDNKSKHNTYMKLGSASVGFQLGAEQNDMLVIFKTHDAMNDFVTNGWGVSGGVAAAAGANDKSAGGGMSGSAMNTSESFTLTKNGVQAGISVSGVKAWKDDELN